MIRPLVLASLIAFVVLPGLPSLARADGFAERGPGPTWPSHRHPHRRTVRHVRIAPVPGPAAYRPAADLAYGWLPRNLNLPIYNAPSEGPAPTL